MKLTALFPLLAALLLTAGCQTPAPAPVPNDGRITVTFGQPDKFTDLKRYFQGPTDQGYLDDLKRTIERTAPRYLADGQRLAIKFTDIDMAGDFLPGRAQLSDVRIMKGIYPPRLKFSYTITDAEGKIVGQGDENLVDMTYQSRTGLGSSNDPLFYEKALFTDWMESRLRK